MRFLNRQDRDWPHMVCSPERWMGSVTGSPADIDVIILGMHARADNPELLRARELGIRIMSFPEYLYEQTKDKKTYCCCRKSWQDYNNCYDNACTETLRNKI